MCAFLLDELPDDHERTWHAYIVFNSHLTDEVKHAMQSRVDDLHMQLEAAEHSHSALINENCRLTDRIARFTRSELFSLESPGVDVAQSPNRPSASPGKPSLFSPSSIMHHSPNRRSASSRTSSGRLDSIGSTMAAEQGAAHGILVDHIRKLSLETQGLRKQVSFVVRVVKHVDWVV